jgi:hypothetical protein
MHINRSGRRPSQKGAVAKPYGRFEALMVDLTITVESTLMTVFVLTSDEESVNPVLTEIVLPNAAAPDHSAVGSLLVQHDAVVPGHVVKLVNSIPFPPL